VYPSISSRDDGRPFIASLTRTTLPRTNCHPIMDWKALETEILQRLGANGIRAELSGRIRFAAGEPSSSGWLPCHAIGRNDGDPSAAVCVAGENGELGRYRDLGGKGASYSLWELLAVLGAYPDWKAARSALAAKVGVDLTSKQSISKKQQDKSQSLLAQLKFDVPKEQFRPIIERFAASRPPLQPTAVLAFAPRVCHWPAKAKPKDQFLCVAIPGLQDSQPVAVVLFRDDGSLFPAVGDKLPERRMHVTRGSSDAWIIGGGQAALASATTIWKAEGPSDAIALLPHLPAGHVVITNVCGATAAKNCPMEIFAGKSVIAIGDMDEAGQRGVVEFAAEAAKVSPDVRIVRFPGREVTESHGFDLRDYFNAGGTFAELQALAEAAEPVKPADPALSETPDNPQKICNAVRVQKGEESHLEPVCMHVILQTIREKSGNQFRRCGETLFFHRRGHDPQFISTPAAFFGLIGTECPPPAEIHRSPGFHGKEEIFEEFRRTSFQYQAIESIPHEPPIPGVYYLSETPEPGDGTALDGLIARFNPETPIDADLFRAMFATTVWGGPGGSRPMFVVTSMQGRGAGKSKNAAMVGHLVRGVIELSSNEDITKLKSRFLSGDGRKKRVALLDNVKSNKLSWAELESLITAPTISGHEMYVGEGHRPNHITWLCTLNGVSLSTDLAQRSVVIRIKRPTYSGCWEEETRRYIDDNRDAIIADLVGFLRGPRIELNRYSRWGAWERDVLCRLADPLEAQLVILERQGDSDVEQEENDIVEEFFHKQLIALAYDPSKHEILIPSGVAAKWFKWATGETKSVTACSRLLRQRIEEGTIQRLAVNQTKVWGRGFLWQGEEWEHNPSDQDTWCKRDLEARIRDRKTDFSGTEFEVPEQAPERRIIDPADYDPSF
jgi:hypothetical protein